MRKIFIIIAFCIFYSCKEDILPKPKAYLSLSYPEKKYQSLSITRPFTFNVLQNTTIVDEKNNWLKIKYPSLKASIDITYREVEDNLTELISEAEKLVFKHAVKAEQIIPKDFTNNDKSFEISIS